MGEGGGKVPKIVWTLWLQGWDSAPPLVQTCLSTWQRRNPGWEVRALNRETIGEYLTVALPRGELPPAALSDVCRVLLLREHGGVWVDATLYCAAPLDSWLDEHLGEGFFAFARPGPDRMLASWFLAAEPAHPLVVAWADLVAEYWRGRAAPDTYFWFHRLFADLYRSDPELGRLWDAVPAIAADGPHYFAPDYAARLGRPLRPHVHRRLLTADPVYKLSHRLGGLPPAPGSTYEFLRSWAQECSPLAPVPSPSASLAVRMAVDRRLEELRWDYLNARRRLRLRRRQAS